MSSTTVISKGVQYFHENCRGTKVSYSYHRIINFDKYIVLLNIELLIFLCIVFCIKKINLVEVLLVISLKIAILTAIV